jgi:membrane protease subunit (stomatin/prohibitin family)
MAVIDLVKYDGPANVLAWKHPNQELGTWTQLVVNESQEAVLRKGGQTTDVFGPGRHTLSTANLPILSALLRLPFGGRSPFTAEVWYVNRLHALDVKWGTPTPVQLQDPKYGVMVPVRSFGQFGVKVEQSAKFLVKLVGTAPSFDIDILTRHFKGLYVNKVKDSLAGFLVKRKIGVLEINAYLDELSEHMAERIRPTFEEYGLALLNFFVNDISVPETDPAVIQLKAALAKRAEMSIIGYNYQQERTFDTLEGAATNPGAAQAGLMGAGLGLGMGVGVGGAMGAQFGGLAQALSVAPTVKCPSGQALVPDGKRFCPDCGAPMGAAGGPPAAPPPLIKCDKCGTPLKPGEQFCPNCGDPYNPCPTCGADMPAGSRICPACGQPVPERCPDCGQGVPQGSKFCPGCGRPMTRKCPACGADQSAAAKFCSACGKPL